MHTDTLRLLILLIRETVAPAPSPRRKETSPYNVPNKDKSGVRKF